MTGSYADLQGQGAFVCVGRSIYIVAVLAAGTLCIPTLVERAYVIIEIDIERLPLGMVGLCNFSIRLFIFLF